jgi:prepilin-type N-terminal cleavage/methylation domain-containing protein
MLHRPPRTSSRRLTRGFTLIELLASVAIALLLIVGINQVFSIASRSISAGQALSTAQRDNRSVQSVIYADLKNIVATNGDPEASAPYFIIESSRVAAFKNQADMLSDRDFNAADSLLNLDKQVRTIDYDGNNKENDLLDELPRTTLSDRNHRVDTLRFFARGKFPRQTGNDGTFVSSLVSGQALITYGHLRQPANPAVITGARDPGTKHLNLKQTQAQNPNNYFAHQFILGRNMMALIEPEVLVGGDEVIMDGGVRQMYIGRTLTDATPPSAADLKRLDPLQENDAPATTDGNNNAAGGFRVEHSRFDVIGGDLTSLRNRVRTAMGARVVGERKWFDDLTYRFAGWPIPTRPHTSLGMARTAPVFVSGCSQFCVEYAGDFLTQNAVTGESTAIEPDGTIDFVPLFNGAGNPVNRRTRWYGFPRNVDTSDDNDPSVPYGARIRGGSDPSAGVGGVNLIDVIPLRDVMMTTPGYVEQAPFEKIQVPNGNTPIPNRLPVKDNYASTNASLNIGNDATYLCAWGPSGTYTNLAGAPVLDPPSPAMLRFVIGIDDPQGRMSDPQLYEYVVDLR